jgi:PAS domain S-box-containing protein
MNENRRIEYLQERIADLTRENKLLRKSENKLRSLFNNLEDIVIEFDYNGTYLSIAPTSPELLFAPSDEMLGKRLHDLFPREQADMFLSLIRESIETQSKKTLDYPLHLQDCVKYFKATVTPLSAKCALYVAREITWQKEYELALKESKERFETLSNATFEGILTHINGVITYANQSFQDMVGYSYEEIIGNNLLEHIPKEDDRKMIIMKMQAPSASLYLVIARKKNGSDFIAEIEGKNLTFRDEQIRIVAVRDVTERERTREALNKSESRFKYIFDFSPISIWEEDFSEVFSYIQNLKKKGITNLNRYFEDNPDEVIQCSKLAKVLDCNESTLELYEATSKDEFFTSLHKVFTPESLHQFKDQLVLMANGEHHYKSIIQNRTLKGKIITVSLKWTVVPEFYSNYGRVLVTIVDVTQKVRAENIQSIVYEISNAFTNSDNIQELGDEIQTHLGVLFDTTNFYITLYNNASDTFNMIYFSDSEDSMDAFPAGKTLTSYLLKTGKSLIVSKAEQLQLHKEGVIDLVGTTSEVWMGVPLSKDKNIFGALVVQSYTDPNAYSEDDMIVMEFISEKISSLLIKKKAQEDLKSIQKRLETANSMLRHDITNDMGVIRSALKIYNVKHDPVFLEEINNRISKSLKLISYHKQQENFIEEHANLISYNLKDIIEVISGNYPNIEIDLKGKGRIFADEAVYSVFDNLISNSLRHGGADKITLEIERKEKRCIVIYRDNGSGIEEAASDRIFEKGFFHGKYGNTGIGLFIVKQIIESYSGSISYLKEDNEGAAFMLIFHCPLLS